MENKQIKELISKILESVKNMPYKLNSFIEDYYLKTSLGIKVRNSNELENTTLEDINKEIKHIIEYQNKLFQKKKEIEKYMYPKYSKNKYLSGYIGIKDLSYELDKVKCDISFLNDVLKRLEYYKNRKLTQKIK
jgi:hypothetical protein